MTLNSVMTVDCAISALAELLVFTYSIAGPSVWGGTVASCRHRNRIHPMTFYNRLGVQPYVVWHEGPFVTGNRPIIRSKNNGT